MAREKREDLGVQQKRAHRRGEQQRMARADGDDSRGLSVAFAHLDLGIGGAEQLVVNAALALKHRGHRVRIYTTHHSPAHSFAPTRGDGELAAGIVVVGDWLPRSIFGRVIALCSTLRMLYLALYVVLMAAKSSIDVVICDGVSAPLPIFRWRFPTLFYCHFPDKLLCTLRASLLKRLYRAPLDWVEEATTAMAHVIVVNSHFTASVFRDAFPRIARGTTANAAPSVLYPVADFASFTPPDWTARERRVMEEGNRAEDKAPSPPPPFVSINRFERKKNVGLAIEALAVLKDGMEASARRAHRSEKKNKSNESSSPVAVPQLVVAGGYDPRVDENVQHLVELKALAADRGVADLVRFEPNVSDARRDALLQGARCVVYTPANEHFGIVPIEAMYAGAPVLAADSGGPRETVVDGVTGFLRPNTPEAFGAAMRRFVVVAGGGGGGGGGGTSGAEHRALPPVSGSSSVRPDSPSGVATEIAAAGGAQRTQSLSLSLRLGKQAHEHVKQRFGMEAFSRQLEEAVRRAMSAAEAERQIGPLQRRGVWWGALIVAVLVGCLATLMGQPSL